MELWHLWLILGLILIIAEMFSLTFYLLVFSFAVLFGAFLDLLGFSLSWQIFAVALVGVILTPFLPKILRVKIQGKGRTSLMAGEKGEINAEVIENNFGGWHIKYQGDTYPYKFAEPESAFELTQGKKVKIIRFDGITAIIKNS